MKEEGIQKKGLRRRVEGGRDRKEGSKEESRRKEEEIEKKGLRMRVEGGRDRNEGSKEES